MRGLMEDVVALLGQFIDGRHEAGSGGSVDVLNPADGSVVATLGEATVDDVDAAVAAARRAYPGWSGATPGERSAALLALADRMEARADEYARVETAQSGKPIKLTTEFDVPGSIDNVRFFAGAARVLNGMAQAEYDGTHTSSIRREPIGVVGSIAPWNYPLQMAMWKILPAVAAGNTIVLKPAEITPLTSLMVAEDALAAGIPAGVINVLTGPGRSVGEALISHPDVSMVSFTGSTPVGQRVMELATGTIKRVHLELGGKAPFVVFDDADLDAAANGAVAGALINTGQDCTAATRAYVQRPHLEAFVEKVAALMDTVRLGDPTDPVHRPGPAGVDAPAGVRPRLRRARRGRGRDGRARRRDPRGRPVRGLVLPADPRRRCGAGLRDRAAGAVRPGAGRAARSTPTTRASRWPTTCRSAWPPRRGPPTPSAPSGPAGRSRPAACGSTTTSRSSPRCRTAGYKASGFGKDMSIYSLEEYTHIKHVSSDITGEVRKDWHRTIFGDR